MFPGFPLEGIKFLRSLSRNNNREWFQPRKGIFDSEVKAPMLLLVEAINTELMKFAPDHIIDPQKSVYRIYRDTRFSADKTPYKNHLAAVFPRRGLDRQAGAGFYFHISAKSVGIACGAYMPGPEQLLAIRIWLSEHHKEFLKAAKKPEKLMGKLQGAALQRIPKGFPAEHPAAELLKKKQWFYWVEMDGKLATTPKLLPEIVRRFRVMMPVVEMLNAPLLTRARAQRMSPIPQKGNRLSVASLD